MTNKFPRVFISYSHKDKEFARMLDTSFVVRGVETFLDDKAIKVGDQIPKRIVYGISESDYLIYIISKSSVQSAWVEEELNIAKIKEKEVDGFRVLPLLIDDIGLPIYVKHIKYADFRDWKNPDSYRKSFLDILYAMDVEPKFLRSKELEWYANNSGYLRGASRMLSTIHERLYAALDTSQSVAYRETPHYMVTKHIFEDEYLLESLKELTEKIPVSHNSNEYPRLGLLKDNTLKVVDYIEKEMDSRESFRDVKKIDKLIRNLQTIDIILSEIEEDFVLILSASFK